MLLQPEPEKLEHIPAFAFLLHAHDKLDDEYYHTFVIYADKVKEVTGRAFDKGFGLNADGVAIDFSYGHSIVSVKKLAKVP